MDRKKYSGASARTYKLLLNHALNMSERGHLPSLNDLAHAAEASRATVYRYFPSQADLVHALMTHSLNNLIEWQPLADTPMQRLREAYDLLFEDFKLHETLFRAVLQLTLLPNHALQHPARLVDGKQHNRGLRIDILKRAIAPLANQISSREYDKLLQNLSLLFGIESLIVLKDICDLDLAQAKQSLLGCAETFINDVLKSNTANQTRL